MTGLGNSRLRTNGSHRFTCQNKKLKIVSGSFYFKIFGFNCSIF